MVLEVHFRQSYLFWQASLMKLFTVASFPAWDITKIILLNHHIVYPPKSEKQRFPTPSDVYNFFWEKVLISYKNKKWFFRFSLSRTPTHAYILYVEKSYSTKQFTPSILRKQGIGFDLFIRFILRHLIKYITTIWWIWDNKFSCIRSIIVRALARTWASALYITFECS